MPISKLLPQLNSVPIRLPVRGGALVKTKTRFQGFVEIVQAVSEEAVPFVELFMWSGLLLMLARAAN